MPPTTRTVSRWTSIVRHAVRQVRHDRAPAIAIVLTMAMGIAPAATIFTVARGVLMRPLPYDDPASLVVLQEYQPAERSDQTTVAHANLPRYRSAPGVAGLTAFAYSEFVLTGLDDTERVIGAAVDGDLLATLGVRPFLGRGITIDDMSEQPARVVVIGYELWQRRFGSDTQLPGQTVDVDGESRTIVGIMPPSFEFPRHPSMSRDIELWVPRSPPSAMMQRRGVRDLVVIARLRQGVATETASAEFTAIATQAEADNRALDQGWRTRLVPLRDIMVGPVRPAILMLVACVGILLFIACANASAAALARTTKRRQAYAVCLALGADRSHLAALALAESILLALASLLIALPASAVARGFLLQLAPVAVPRQQLIVTDGTTFVFAVVVALLAGLASSFAPMRWLRGVDASRLMREDGRTSTLSRGGKRNLGGFVVAQLALGTALAAITLTVYTWYSTVHRVDPGFVATNVLTATIPLRGPRYADPRARALLTEQLLARVRGLPGVERAAVATLMPLGGGLMSRPYQVVGASGDSSTIAVQRAISTDFFRTLGITIRAGREFNAGDDADAAPVVVVNEEFVRQAFDGRPAMGATVTFAPPGMSEPRAFRVVGIVGNARETNLVGPSTPIIYLSDRQASFPHTVLAVRGHDTTTPIEAIRAILRDLDPTLALDDVGPLSSKVRSTYSLQYFLLNVLTVFAVSAGLLIGVGVFGLVTYIVSMDVRGIGVRMALGASPGTVLVSVLSRSVIWAGVGGAIGLGLATAVTRIVRVPAFQLDPVSAVLGAIAILGLTVTATWLPAWRASRTDPLIAISGR